MARYLINLKTGTFHDRHYSGERCNLDDSNVTGLIVKTWRETENITASGVRQYRYCRWCWKQERYERGALQT